jgi:hypothetical protein
VLSVLAACGTPLFTRTVSADATQATTVVPDSARASHLAVGYFGTTQADAVRAIGEAYLKHMRIESSPAAILTAAAGTLALIDAARTQTANTTALVAAVRRDFQEGRVVDLQGWVLSRTELELCALTLLPPG